MIDHIRFEPKKDSPADYVGTVERLGLDLGPEGPITRDKADEARRFLQRTYAERHEALCGDILQPGTLVAEAASTGAPGGAAGLPGGGGPGGGGGGGNPVPPPVLPPLPPASPDLPTAFARSR
jgi:hypothetical protein